MTCMEMYLSGAGIGWVVIPQNQKLIRQEQRQAQGVFTAAALLTFRMHGAAALTDLGSIRILECFIPVSG